ncbi:hypothetical protein [Cryptosporangium aurantiacum]|uniref:Uncharacterized protein n=1 Tax=Cryptosporangium aurantiacum TaxID=134849 RepID=A0A1M7KSQ0_9ACTN|nr:hypothetical protein [Cryptosporangium aurantiacum]SHM68527.1 hypothetical protein SAMN05443668_1011247 [Cryptosporangium aurantiacum]
MLATQLAALVDGTPAGTAETLDLVDGFDACLVTGFGRLGDDGAAALTALAAGVAVTPLGDRASEAAAKLAAGSIADEHLTTLAGARAALLGAVHDALLDRADTAVGRPRSEWVAADADAPDAPRNLLEGCRSWLRELAVTGWRGVDHDLVSSSGQVLEAMLMPSVVTQPRLRRLAVLVDGLAAELRASAPIATMDELPVRRWADLWARAMLLCQPGTWPAGAAETVSGRLLVLGVDVHEHATAVQVQVHGLLELAGETTPRLVRTTVAAAKVDTIVGPAIWRLFDGYPALLAALTDGRALTVTDLTLLSSGDLLWADDRAQAGDPADPFVTARIHLAGAVAPAVPPLDRHPVRLAEPVLVEGYAVDDGVLVLDGHRLALDLDRLPTLGPLTPELVTGSTACLGLLRWDDGQWSLQPLAIQATVKRKPVPMHVGDWASGPTDPKVAKAVKAAGDTVAVLRERASRLLRK